MNPGRRTSISRRLRVRAPALLLTFALAAVTLGSCGPGAATSGQGPAGTAAGATSVPSVRAGDDTVVVVAAGDIASTPEAGEATADLISTLAPDAVLALGDNAYENGSAQDYMSNYDPSWGQLKDITKPVPGNHDYRTDEAAGYFDYFRDQIHDQAYYAWDAGRWRMYALNCEIACDSGSAQLRWLTQELATRTGAPSLAYVHQPLYSCSTGHKPLERLGDIWQVLLDGGGQLMLAGHNHAYERFARQDARGGLSSDGLRQFVVGTGGDELYPLTSPCPHREAQTDGTAGVLRLELRADSYTWQFIGVDGVVLDSGVEQLS
ncbi:MAG: metallophosphoesterase family protein [Geodermatophilaceae bacterium]